MRGDPDKSNVSTIVNRGTPPSRYDQYQVGLQCAFENSSIDQCKYERGRWRVDVMCRWSRQLKFRHAVIGCSSTCCFNWECPVIWTTRCESRRGFTVWARFHHPKDDDLGAAL